MNSELLAPQTKLAYLQQELLRLCSCSITEEDLISIRSLIDSFLHTRHQRYLPELAEEFGSTRDDFDEWGHDPGK